MSLTHVKLEAVVLYTYLENFLIRASLIISGFAHLGFRLINLVKSLTHCHNYWGNECKFIRSLTPGK